MAEDKLREVIARAWKDEDFKKKLIADPKSTLAAAGVNVGNVKVNVHVDTADTVNLVIPQNPANSELAEDALDSIAGGCSALEGPGTAFGSVCPDMCEK